MVCDTGNFIPGHGGMLDRMDAFMISIPALYIYYNLICWPRINNILI